MITCKFFVDKDKETKWLNEMMESGYAMTGFFGGFYSFDRCEPGKYIYQIDLTDGFFRVSEDYREFMTDAGVEVVGVWGFWVFLRRRAGDGEFQLYTDVESTIEHYKKIRRMFKVACIVELICLFYLLLSVGMGSGVLALPGVFIIGAIILAMIREVTRINDILGELYARLGKEPDFHIRTRKVSILLPAGMFVNAVASMMRLQENRTGEFLCMFFQICAILLILAGIFFTWQKRE